MIAGLTGAVKIGRKAVGRLHGRWRQGQLERSIPAWTGLTERLGSEYGGWWIASSQLDRDSTVYSAGLGEDGSFDVAVARVFGADVHVFDPTPRAVAFAQNLMGQEPRIRFHPIGLWKESDTLKFYEPRDPTFASYSAINLQETKRYVECPVRDLYSLMSDLGHAQVDLLKMDIEGAEHVVIESILASAVRPKAICVEFDQPCEMHVMRRTIGRLRGRGYRLARREGWNFTFVLTESVV